MTMTQINSFRKLKAPKLLLLLPFQNLVFAGRVLVIVFSFVLFFKCPYENGSIALFE